MQKMNTTKIYHFEESAYKKSNNSNHNYQGVKVDFKVVYIFPFIKTIKFMCEIYVHQWFYVWSLLNLSLRP